VPAAYAAIGTARALSSATASRQVQPGYDFPVVWVCSEEEWQAAHAEGREPEGLPWPAKHVQLAEELALRES
jgi:hypothetical protein